MKSLTALLAKKELRKHANPKKAEVLRRFFKTGPGQYGEGDRFIGVMVPTTRKIATQFGALSLAEIKKLAQSKIHEERLLAGIILTLQFKKYPERQEAVFKFYVQNRKCWNNWDLIDVTAPRIIGAYLSRRDRSLLYKWARSRNLWERRLSILPTFHFIKEGDFSDTLRISELLLGDEEDLIHKAVGWMLREMGKKDVRPLLAFLETHARKMPRTMLRYSIEKLSPEKRSYYMKRN